MKHSKRVEMFSQAKKRYIGFLSSALWKLTGDRELFTEAMQYALLGIWRHIEKLSSKKAGAYIYRIALSANSRAWRNRIGRNGQISENQIGNEPEPIEQAGTSELEARVRQAVAELPAKQGRAIVMRYFEQKDYGDIAENLRCSQAGARSHVSKALATLKTRLAALTVEVE
jgi:RNA polymerase sigma factor (sigma-70 family)